MKIRQNDNSNIVTYVPETIEEIKTYFSEEFFNDLVENKDEWDFERDYDSISFEVDISNVIDTISQAPGGEESILKTFEKSGEVDIYLEFPDPMGDPQEATDATVTAEWDSYVDGAIQGTVFTIAVNIKPYWPDSWFQDDYNSDEEWYERD